MDNVNKVDKADKKVINYPVFIDLKPKADGIELIISDRVTSKIVARSLLKPDMHRNLNMHFSEVIEKGNHQIWSRIWRDTEQHDEIHVTIREDITGISRRTSIFDREQSIRHFPDLFSQLKEVLTSLDKWD